MNQHIQAGLYRMSITPSLDIPVVGSWNDEYMEGYLDDLHVNALVLDDGKTEAAVVSADVCCIHDPIIQDLLSAIESDCGIKAANITISATHTHRGPKLLAQNRDYYTQYFMNRIVSCVHMAHSIKRPVRISSGKGENRNHVFNRRMKRPDGTVVMNWIELDELDDCRRVGEVDPELLILRIESEDGNPLGFVINYGNHNNAVSEPKFSADIAGYIGYLLRRIYGDEIVSLFLLRNCGNVNWIDVNDKDHRWDPNLYKLIATGLTGTILETIPRLEYPRIEDIMVVRQIVRTYERETSDIDREEYSPDGKKRKDADMFALARKDLDRGRIPYDVDVHVIRIGDEIAIATNPGEMFVEFSRELIQDTPFRYQLIAEQTNGRAGYIPTEEAFAEGGYEVRKPANRLEPDAGNKIVAATKHMLNDAKAEIG